MGPLFHHTPKEQERVAVFGLIVNFITSIGLILLLVVVRRLQKQALEGDEQASRRMILPCYKPFILFLAIYFFLEGIVFLIFLVIGFRATRLFTLVQFSYFSSVAVYTVVPCILIMKFITYENFWHTFRRLAPWVLVSWFLLGLPGRTEKIDQGLEFICQILFLLIGPIPSLILGCGMTFGVIKSRMNNISLSSTNGTALLIISSLILTVTTIIFLSYCQVDESNLQKIQALTTVSWVMIISQGILNLLLPLAAYRTLNADTKYWRGMGKYHEGGIRKGGNVITAEQINEYKMRQSMSQKGELPRASIMSQGSVTKIDLSMASMDFQTVLNSLGSSLIDFAFVDIENKIGEGATATVYSGHFNKNLVAVKVTCPPEITAESLESFRHEANMMKLMKHDNIVKFYGIIIRPPQVGMVFEMCEGGSLKENLSQNGAYWSYRDRINACFQAASAIGYIHSKKVMHRDIKPDNFFVGKNKTVKIGDFGESCFTVNEEDLEEKMEICGTVAYMAPELVKGVKYYNEKIDIYALGISFWEILTDQEPYADIKTFEIYTHVLAGKRLPLDGEINCLKLKSKDSNDTLESGMEGHISSKLSIEMKSIIEAAWCQGRESRPDGKLLADMLEMHLDTISPDANLRQSLIETKQVRKHFADEDLFSKEYWKLLFESLKHNLLGLPIKEEETRPTFDLSSTGGMQKRPVFQKWHTPSSSNSISNRPSVPILDKKPALSITGGVELQANPNNNPNPKPSNNTENETISNPMTDTL